MAAVNDQKTGGLHLERHQRQQRWKLLIPRFRVDLRGVRQCRDVI